MSETDPTIAALLRERSFYERQGKADRTKQVDAALKALGHDTKSAPPAGRRAPTSEQA